MFTDLATGGAMTKVATEQEYSPEWLLTAYQYQDVALLARTAYDQDAVRSRVRVVGALSAHRRGGSGATLNEWYWGKGVPRLRSSRRRW